MMDKLNKLFRRNGKKKFITAGLIHGNRCKKCIQIKKYMILLSKDEIIHLLKNSPKLKSQNIATIKTKSNDPHWHPNIKNNVIDNDKNNIINIKKTLNNLKIAKAQNAKKQININASHTTHIANIDNNIVDNNTNDNQLELEDSKYDLRYFKKYKILTNNGEVILTNTKHINKLTRKLETLNKNCCSKPDIIVNQIKTIAFKSSGSLVCKNCTKYYDKITFDEKIEIDNKKYNSNIVKLVNFSKETKHSHTLMEKFAATVGLKNCSSTTWSKVEDMIDKKSETVWIKSQKRVFNEIKEADAERESKRRKYLSGDSSWIQRGKDSRFGERDMLYKSNKPNIEGNTFRIADVAPIGRHISDSVYKGTAQGMETYGLKKNIQTLKENDIQLDNINYCRDQDAATGLIINEFNKENNIDIVETNDMNHRMIGIFFFYYYFMFIHVIDVVIMIGEQI